MRALCACLLAFAALAAPAAARPLPDVVSVPDGFQPEGLATGKGATFYTGSIPTGAVWAGSLRTGQGRVLVPPHAGRNALGMDVEHRRLLVAGGPSGGLFAYDARTGADLAAYPVGGGFVNDVIATRRAAFFTDSVKPQLYVLRLGPRGRLPAAAQTLPLSGDVVYDDDPSTFDLNGIDATRNGKKLISVQTRTGKLFRINPRTGVTREIPLSGGDAAFGDGILLHGRTLYVVQNQLDRIEVVRLSRGLRSGRVVRTLTDPDLDVPTGIAAFAGALYAVNAKFGQTGPDVPYEVVRVAKR